MYGNLATIIMVMLWLYFCMNLLLYGAEINAYFENEFRLAHRSVKGILAHEKRTHTVSKDFGAGSKTAGSKTAGRNGRDGDRGKTETKIEKTQEEKRGTKNTEKWHLTDF